MAIKAILDKLEDAPEALREHYEAGTKDAGTEGKYVLKVEAVGGWSLEDVTGLKSALGKERTDREAAERNLVKFKDIDPDKARAALKALEEMGSLDPKADADKIVSARFEAAKAQLVEKHEAELSPLRERVEKLTGTVDNLVRVSEATAAIAEAKGSVDLLLPHVLKSTRTVEKDGKFLTEVVDEGGNVRIADTKGAPMGIKDLVAEMRQQEAFARAFDGEGQTGTGKTPDKPGGRPKADLGGNRAERTAAIASKFNLPAT